MALTKEDLLAIAELMDSKLEPINDRLSGLELGQKRLESKVEEGFDDLKNLINVAAQDAAQTEKKLLEHLDAPHIA